MIAMPLQYGIPTAGSMSGYVPAELARTLGRVYRGRDPFGATAFFEILEGKRRVALSVLIAPASFLQTLTIEDEED